MRDDVLPLVTSKRFRSMARFAGPLPGVDTRNRILRARGTNSDRICQASACIHRRPLLQARRALSGATVSDPGKAAGGPLQTCRANRGRGNLLPNDYRPLVHRNPESNR